MNIRWFQISQLKTPLPHTKKTVVLFETVGEYHLHFWPVFTLVLVLRWAHIGVTCCKNGKRLKIYPKSGKNNDLNSLDAHRNGGTPFVEPKLSTKHFIHMSVSQQIKWLNLMNECDVPYLTFLIPCSLSAGSPQGTRSDWRLASLDIQITFSQQVWTSGRTYPSVKVFDTTFISSC